MNKDEILRILTGIRALTLGNFYASYAICSDFINVMDGNPSSMTKFEVRDSLQADSVSAGSIFVLTEKMARELGIDPSLLPTEAQIYNDAMSGKYGPKPNVPNVPTANKVQTDPKVQKEIEDLEKLFKME